MIGERELKAQALFFSSREDIKYLVGDCAALKMHHNHQAPPHRVFKCIFGSLVAVSLLVVYMYYDFFSSGLSDFNFPIKSFSSFVQLSDSTDFQVYLMSFAILLDASYVFQELFQFYKLATLDSCL